MTKSNVAGRAVRAGAAVVALGLGAIAITAAGDTTADTAAVSPDSGYTLELAFVTHLDMDLPEQDVFIEREKGSDQVWRVTKGDNNMNAPLFKAAEPIRHDPFNPDAIGPHPRGAPLGLTLGQWLKHSATASYTCNDGQAELKLNASGLVPNGVYTIWHVFIALPPTTPFSGTLDIPLGARDGSESVFVANADGSARVVKSFKPCLEMSDVWTTTMLALAYHSDGKTYLADPGEFGLNTHVPLFVSLPNREGL